MRFVDTHCHLIYLDRFRYPWLDAEPALNRDFHIDRYLAEARPAGITDIIHMEVDVAESDMEKETEFVTTLGVDALIAACRPESPAFEAYVDRATANPKVKGFRRILHTQPDGLSQTPLFAENLRLLGKRGISFDLCLLARQLPIGLKLVEACPDVQFVLDHCGVPDVKARQLDPWRRDISALAARPNVACKVSGVVAYGPADWTVDDLRPYVEHVIEAFGWDRVVWGSDWPVCTQTADLTRWVAAARELTKGASDSEKERLFGLNAERIYRLS